MSGCTIDPPKCPLTGDIVGREIRGGPELLEFVALLEEPVDGLISRDGEQSSATWTLALGEIVANTPTIASQCPDVTMEGIGRFTLEGTNPPIRGTGPFAVDTWTVDGFALTMTSQTAEMGDFTGTLRVVASGEDYDAVHLSEGSFRGNDGVESVELTFSTFR